MSSVKTRIPDAREAGGGACSAPPGRSLLVVAGEASADQHGARVIQALRRLCGGLDCFGLGGPRLREAGLAEIADASALAVVGISEVVRGLGRIRRVFRSVLQACADRRPGAALLIDLPDFNLRLARRLGRMGIPVLYYIAPQAWAWRRGRVRQLRRRVRRLCVVFPFEREFFARYGITVEFVGHPLSEEGVGPAAARPRTVAIVPGSRPREIERLLPALAGAARILAKRHPPLDFVLPLAPGVSEEQVRALLEQAGLEATLVHGGAARALAGARLALIASGTATLEAAFAGVPMVVVYRVSRTTYALVRPVFRLDHVCIVNILAGREVVPELLQRRVRPEIIADKALPLLLEGEERETALRGMAQVVAGLGTDQPSERVAERLAGLLEEHG